MSRIPKFAWAVLAVLAVLLGYMAVRPGAPAPTVQNGVAPASTRAAASTPTPSSTPSVADDRDLSSVAMQYVIAYHTVDTARTCPGRTMGDFTRDGHPVVAGDMLVEVQRMLDNGQRVCGPNGDWAAMAATRQSTEVRAETPVVHRYTDHAYVDVPWRPFTTSSTDSGTLGMPTTTTLTLRPQADGSWAVTSDDPPQSP